MTGCSNTFLLALQMLTAIYTILSPLFFVINTLMNDQISVCCELNVQVYVVYAVQHVSTLLQLL